MAEITQIQQSGPEVELANAQPIPDPLLEQPDFAVPAALEAEVEELLTHYPKKRSASLMLLHAVQEHFGYISRQAVEWVAQKLELQPINVYELVTFYPMLQQQPVGTYHLRVCRTLSCALGGSYELHEHFCQKLGLDPKGHGRQTTKDGKFTVEFVECLASCGTAPVMMCNAKFYEGVSQQKADEILTGCQRQ
ncbi:MAG TPA: NAD(P)H-dependent oxidoreductase subunit E [Verrucomicrobiae bacterium]|nr:NAD(P)H-dependent oxidoreductase subunit E [Verrucomicrobiae bacterium]